MQRHTKIYLQFFGYSEQDFIECSICGKRSVDIHHILQKGMGGSKTKDYIENLIALCRTCHNDCHENKYKKSFLFNLQKQKINERFQY